MKRSENDNENATEASQEGLDNKDNVNSSPLQSMTQTEAQEKDIDLPPQEKGGIEYGETQLAASEMENETAVEISTQVSSGEGDDDDKSYDFNDCEDHKKDAENNLVEGAEGSIEFGQSAEGSIEFGRSAEGSIEFGRSAGHSQSLNNSSAWSLHPDEGLPTRYEPPNDDSRTELVAKMNESMTEGLLPDPEDLLLAVTGEKKDNNDIETSDDNNVRTSDNNNVGISDDFAEGANDDNGEGTNINGNAYEISNFMETIHEERKRRLFIRGMGSWGSFILPSKRIFYIHLLMICLFIASLCIVVGLEQIIIWSEKDTSSTYSPPYSPSPEGGGGENEGLDFWKVFLVSESFVQKIHGYDLETMDLKQIHKFESTLASYTDLYAENRRELKDGEEVNAKNSTAATAITPKVRTRCVLNNQVLSSWERKRKHQQDEDDTTRERRLRIFDLNGVANSLEVHFTMEYTSHEEIEDDNYPKKFQQYMNGEEGKATFKSALHDMDLNVEEFGVLYLKGEEPNEEVPSSITTNTPSTHTATASPPSDPNKPHSSVFEKIP